MCFSFIYYKKKTSIHMYYYWRYGKVLSSTSGANLAYYRIVCDVFQ